MLPPPRGVGDTAVVLTLTGRRLYYANMNDAISSPPPARVFSRETERNLAALEQRIDRLSELCTRLHTERESLAAERSQLAAESEALRADNQHIRNRIDAMVARLKGLEDRD